MYSLEEKIAIVESYIHWKTNKNVRINPLQFNPQSDAGYSNNLNLLEKAFQTAVVWWTDSNTSYSLFIQMTNPYRA